MIYYSTNLLNQNMSHKNDYFCTIINASKLYFLRRDDIIIVISKHWQKICFYCEKTIPINNKTHNYLNAPFSKIGKYYHTKNFKGRCKDFSISVFIILLPLTIANNTAPNAKRSSYFFYPFQRNNSKSYKPSK